MPRKPRKKYSCDFETTTKREDCRVWAFGCMEIGNKENFIVGSSIDDFMAWAEKSQCDCYFHNLSFDGEFIVSYLLHNGWEYSDEPKEKTFKGICTPDGWYQISLCYGFEYPKKGKPRKKHTTFYDALRKLPFTVADLAKAYNLPIKKGKIDYHAHRPPGYEMTQEEYEYLKNDVEIVAEALHSQFEQGLTGWTIGMDAKKDFIKMFEKNDKGKFEQTFPVFSQQLHEDIMPFYKGGFNWLNNKYQEEVLDEGMVLDANSNYPSQMRYKPMPYGYPEFYFGEYEHDEEYPLYLQMITCEFVLKPGHSIPCVQTKDKTSPLGVHEWLKSSQGYNTTLHLTGQELALFLEHYIVWDLEYVAGWKFKAQTGMFDEYIEKWLREKNLFRHTAKGENAKLMLNYLTGKFATGIKRTKKYPEIDPEDGKTVYNFPQDEDGNVIEEYGKPVYLPVAIFINAYARCELIKLAYTFQDRYIYSDTDSLHILGLDMPKALENKIDSKNLGYWKVECEFEKAYYIKPKAYAQIQYGETVQTEEERWEVFPCRKSEADARIKSLKCSGLPEDVKQGLSFRQFRRGLTIDAGKPQAVYVKGGVVLESNIFTIK